MINFNQDIGGSHMISVFCKPSKFGNLKVMAMHMLLISQNGIMLQVSFKITYT